MTKKLLLVPVVIAACGWSWLSYLLSGFPLDKLAYRADAWGWLSSLMDVPWAEYQAHPSFHELKNLGAEWCRAWPQTAAKVLSMVIVILFALVVLLTIALVLALVF